LDLKLNNNLDGAGGKLKEMKFGIGIRYDEFWKGHLMESKF
jgi:hypothetical protein